MKGESRFNLMAASFTTTVDPTRPMYYDESEQVREEGDLRNKVRSSRYLDSDTLEWVHVDETRQNRKPSGEHVVKYEQRPLDASQNNMKQCRTVNPQMDRFVPPALEPFRAYVIKRPSIQKSPSEKKESCVPRGPILSLEKELIESWRNTNEYLIPHFAKLELAKGVNQTMLKENERMGAATRMLRRIANRNARKAKNAEGMNKEESEYSITKKYGGALSQNTFNPCTRPDHENRPWLSRYNQDEASPYQAEEAGPNETEEECRARRAATVVSIIGCGKMGSRLAELWARGGYKVLVGSRDQLRGEETARRLTESISNQVTSSIEGGTMEWAADQGDIIVLATPFTATIQVLSVIQEFIHGQHKIILDITNPIYDHNAIESVAALDLHMAFLDDPTASWAVGYKSVFVNRLNFGSRHSQESARSKSFGCG
ncbi:hypothetical protein GUITHDRAFT_104509 [Guillardia theta CCMP2712]|uniref:Pyrroline-5-carboxylate reductase catalytic N-terminal domain-containing protein n=1 Tax=Guillardia theta (strain CCMP2712) TaxID=905079 RepID=L1JM88_GUITC|nr:hypothetical protein GUITHDRAFT_104509 [Guillardia theta CCMP2712]EKX49547.1 hypothetical protein GUITHDRAFT_104509 [Guillardia theta CCMP2712]|eukprot:XP_005836527.1 hypothetical protein GUITHDRAFT_104509 [Guillardia theta CCMP2712]